MPEFVSLNRKISELQGCSEEEQIGNTYRLITWWLVAAIREAGGSLHFTKRALEDAAKHLSIWGEMPTFRVEHFPDGCIDVQVVESLPLETSQ